MGSKCAIACGAFASKSDFSPQDSQFNFPWGVEALFLSQLPPYVTLCTFSTVSKG